MIQPNLKTTEPDDLHAMDPRHLNLPAMPHRLVQPRPGHPSWLLPLLLALGFVAAPNVQAAASVSLGSPSGGPGEDAQVSVQFQADGNPVALQFDVHFDAAKLTAGYAVAGAVGSGQSIESSSPSPGVARVVVYSLSNRVIVNGALVTLPLRVLPAAAVGASPITVSNVIVSDLAAARISPITTAAGAVTIRNDRAPVLDRPTIAANGQLTLRLNGQDGRSYTLQFSSNLDTWQDLATQVASGSVAVFTDTPAAGVNVRYYRAIQVP